MYINIATREDKTKSAIRNEAEKHFVFNDNNIGKFEHYIGLEDWSIFDDQHLNFMSPTDAYNMFERKFKTHFDRAFVVQDELK